MCIGLRFLLKRVISGFFEPLQLTKKRGGAFFLENQLWKRRVSNVTDVGYSYFFKKSTPEGALFQGRKRSATFVVSSKKEMRKSIFSRKRNRKRRVSIATDICCN